MRTQYYTASSLDGYIADERHSLDWLFQLDAGGETSYPDFFRDVGAVAMGSGTYEWLLRNHVYADPDDHEPWPFEIPAWVFSSRELDPVPDADLRFVRGDVRPVHREMAEAAGGRNVWISGGGDLVGQFWDAGLLDELIVQIAPVTLGGGAPLLPRRIASPPLRLTHVRTYGGVFVEVRYDVVYPEDDERDGPEP